MEKKKINKSQEAILQAGKSLFWKYGVKRVSVEEISKEAGISKMTFYRHFKNKNEVIEKIMKRLFEWGLEEYQSVMRQEIPFAQKIEQIILKKFENTQDVSQEFIKDMYINGNEDIQKMITEYTVTTLNEFKNDLIEAQKKGWIRKDIKIELIMKMRDVMTGAIQDDGLMALYQNPQEAIVEITRFFFYGMMNTDQKES